jgi:transposase
MLRLEQWMDLHVLHKQGHSIRAIAELSGHARNTVRRVLRQNAPKPFQKTPRSSLLDPFKSYLTERFGACRLSAVRLLEEIRPMGYTGSIVTLRRFLAALKPQQLALEKLTVRFETPPGQQAQADWAYCGRHPDGQGAVVPVYVFVMVLSFSRMLFVAFTRSMNLASLIDCHQQAFDFFSGWPQSILYDNMKQVKLSPDQWHPLFVDFANHYGFVPKTHRIRRPRTKGKVERMVHYVKDNFLNGRNFADFADLNAQARHWLSHTANVRLHATTGQRPTDLCLQENLIPLTSGCRYQLSQPVPRKAGSDSFVRFGGSRYSVPPAQAGQALWVEQREQKILIRCQDLIVAEHAVALKPGSSVADPTHLEALWKLTLQRQAEPLPSWKLTFQDSVATPSLALYQEVAP